MRKCARISVIGAGYVGLVTGACFAELGHTVTCIEIDRDRLSSLRSGQVPIYEPGLAEIIARNVGAGRLCFTDAYDPAVSAAAFTFIAVQTPTTPNGHADTRFVVAALQAVLALARPGHTIVVKSTVPVGTGDALAVLVGELGVEGIEVVSNPEFLREGCAVADFMQPDRVVVGAANLAAGEAVAGLYGALGAPAIVCGRRSAELAKYAANALLAARISFMNEVAAVCDAAHADIDDVARIVGSDRRIGPAFLRAGLGWGGSCFPKDVRALAAVAHQLGVRPTILDAVFDVNADQQRRAFERLFTAVRSASDPTVCVLGLAFKPDTDDVRESPALAIVERLLEAGVRVRVHDPVAMVRARARVGGAEYCDDAYDAALGADALLLATEWADYRSLSWERLRDRMRGRFVLDGRNVLDRAALQALGFTYASFGRTHGHAVGDDGLAAAASPLAAGAGQPTLIGERWSRAS